MRDKSVAKSLDLKDAVNLSEYSQVSVFVNAKLFARFRHAYKNGNATKQSAQFGKTFGIATPAFRLPQSK
ncbi:hypothetical protein [Methylomonas rhizoryzae]|uniref:hypothetical protein n=1 Tax=Methylomonas rhizoryzae TaxID=2608981 RepID=UPI0012319A03|nr:hypothetical protein [Methylomonas rhizoryzae]